jgi:hypothetical protein
LAATDVPRALPRTAVRRLAPDDVFFDPRTVLDAFFVPEAFFG